MAAQERFSHKQRALAAFAHREADRVPLFEQSIASDVASRILGRDACTGTTFLHYQEACAWMQGETAHAEFEERLYRDVVDIYRALDLDMLRAPWRKSERPAARVDEYTFIYGDPDGEHDVYRFDPRSKTFGHVRSAGKKILSSVEDLEREVERWEKRTERLRIDDPWEYFGMTGRLQKEYGEEYLVVGSGGITIPLTEDWLTACVLAPDLVKRFLEVQLRHACILLEAQARMGLKVIWGGGDLADKNGPVYGPAVFRDIFLPYIKRLTARCEELGLYYVFRTDGNLHPVEREFFAESGIHGYGEIDYEAGMQIPPLKKRYGDRITFWGNVPTGTLLLNGTPEEVADFTRRLVEEAAPGGGFILGSSNSIMPNTPPENVVAMFEAGKAYRLG